MCIRDRCLGLTSKNLLKLMEDRETRPLARDILDKITEGSGIDSNEVMKYIRSGGTGDNSLGKVVLDQVLDKRAIGIDGERALDIYRKLANPRSNKDVAERIREAMSGYYTKGQPNTAKKWNAFTKRTREMNDLWSTNKGGFPFLLKRHTVGGMKKTDENISPELLDRFWNDILKGTPTPLTKKVATALDDPGRMRRAHLESLAAKMLSQPLLPPVGAIPYPTRPGVLSFLGKYFGGGAYKKARRALLGPHTPVPGGIEAFLRPPTKGLSKKDIQSHILNELVYKRAGKATFPPAYNLLKGNQNTQKGEQY